MSTKLSIKQAVKVIPVSESSLRRAIKNGDVSSEKDDRGRRLIDTAELIRVYGELSNESVNGSQMNSVDTSKIVDLLEEQVSDLKSQLEKSTERESKLMDMLKTEQEKTKLMLPPPKKEPSSWWKKITALTGNSSV